MGLRGGRFELDRPEQLAEAAQCDGTVQGRDQARRLSVTLREVLEVDAPRDRVDSGPGPEKG